ncbi:MAG: DUF3048 domain-containing protein [Acidimicrobiales bacterium]|nr:MAG: DUF3048 domain-containing protein [Acidimicrobiales bacterium]
MLLVRYLSLMNADRPHRGLLAVLLLAVLAMVSSATQAAGAAITDDQVQLESSEAALETRIVQAVIALDELRVERSELTVDIETITAAIEGNADAMEQLALQQQSAIRQRAQVAIELFMNGDPAAEAFSAELQGLEGGPSPLQNSEALQSVVEASATRAAELGAEIRALANEVTGSVESREAASQQLSIVDSALLEVQAQLDNDRAEITQVTADLEWYRDSSGRSPITGRDNVHGNDRPALAVKIDNVPRARPQSGVNQADLVFVELVEGQQTRLAAVFHSQEVPVVGPVRSMRTTDVKLLQMLTQPLFANSGGNSRTTQIVNSSPLVNIGHATSAGGAYYRINSRPAPHNLFSSTAALRNRDGNRAGIPGDILTIRRPGTELTNTSAAATGVDVDYGNTSVAYTWNGSGWARSQDGRQFVDTAGVRVAPETVIVQFTRYGVSPADASSPEAISTGSGTAWIFTEGRLIQGTWNKPKARNVTTYKDADGKEIALLPGRVWIELPRPGRATHR